MTRRFFFAFALLSGGACDDAVAGEKARTYVRREHASKTNRIHWYIARSTSANCAFSDFRWDAYSVVESVRDDERQTKHSHSVRKATRATGTLARTIARLV